MTTTTARRAILDQALADAQHAARDLAWLRAQTLETALTNWEFLWEEKRYADAAQWFRAMVVPMKGNER